MLRRLEPFRLKECTPEQRITISLRRPNRRFTPNVDAREQAVLKSRMVSRVESIARVTFLPAAFEGVFQKPLRRNSAIGRPVGARKCMWLWEK